MFVYLGFQNGKIVTVIYSILEDHEAAIDCDYYVNHPQDAEEQITEWKKEHEKE